MKRALYILFLLTSLCGFAQEQAPQLFQGNCPGELPTSPYYYCDCRNAQPFQFPLKVAVTDTMWYSTSLNDMKQGLCAYWFSDCSITFEIYAFCSSKAPSFAMTVSANQMREMSVEKINEKLEAMGDQAEALGQILTPRIRVYPNGGSGTVYCYPYDQGPASTCDSLLQVFPGMTYVCDRDTEVYELKPAKISSYGSGFIRWQQQKNQQGTIWLTEGSCDGTEIGRAVMSDSMHVYVLDSVKMQAAKNAGNSVFVHVAHDASYVGRMMYHNTINWDKQTIDTTICQGKSLKLADTVLTQTTSYTRDTLWVKHDTLALTTFNLTVEEPTPIYDTLKLKYRQFPYTYRNNILPKEGWGDYDFTVRQADKCDERYLLHVDHNYVTTTTVVDTTLCLGKTIKISGKTYSRDTVIHDSVWTYEAATNATPDTYTIRHITLHFAEPDVEYDTISVLPSKMTNRGYWYSTLGVMVFYGDTMIVKKKNNTCTRYIQLHVDKSVVMTEADTDTTLCLGRAITFNSITYTTDTAFYDTIQVDEDTWQRGTISIHFENPVTEYDTLVLDPFQTEMPFGDTLLVIEAEDQCTRWIQRHVTFDDTPIVTTTDTTLCMGKTMTVGEVPYATDTVVSDSLWMEPGLWQITNYTIRFTEPEMEYDTITVTPEQMIEAGDTLIVIEEENECTRWIMRHVEVTEAIENTAAPSDGVYKYMLDGHLYIRREGKEYDLLGRPINRK